MVDGSPPKCAVVLPSLRPKPAEDLTQSILPNQPSNSSNQPIGGLLSQGLDINLQYVGLRGCASEQASHS